MTNSIKSTKTLLAKFFSILLIAGMMAGCASVADSGLEAEPEETAVKSETPVVNPLAGDEMTPIITDAPSNQGR